MISSDHIQRSVQGREAQHSAAMRRAWSWQLEARTPDAATVSELAQLRTPGSVSEALRELKATQRRLALAVLPGAVADCERTAAAVLAEARKWEPHGVKLAHHAALISAVRMAVSLAVVKLAHDQLGVARRSDSSHCHRNRSHNTESCTRRAACVGTSAPAAPPAVVGQRPTAAQLCADQSGVSPPM